MCLLFFIKDSDPPVDGYRLVLVNNRDEFWERQTELASFGGKDKRVVCGRDCMQGREGGTWVGMSREGRLGVLLNILGQLDPDKKPRGRLVTNFVSGNQSIEEYFSEISHDANQYNGFNLVLVDVGKVATTTRLFSNALGYNGTHINQLEDGEVHGVGNAMFEKPWKKICYGREKFQKICQNYAKVDSKELLIKSLQEMMTDRTKTTTVILVDRDGHCDFIEKTIVTPVCVEDPKFTTTALNFKLIN
ncbi:transport and Golgi organization protein 2 homolog isoform X2 [Gigantopelta aegis]|uniref:transport and Golgi organization protein 2 homolog isoform X2 n=1 Tax=Gigantopelta aegis TaxID=1735272 RepID=UPI001B88AB5A|nr:transport and Golgi organization protein 2 homolog isoform X2 [Gigantopelta aegis]